MKQQIKKQGQYTVSGKSGAKSIIDLILADPKPKTIKNAELYDSLGEDRKVKRKIPSGTEFTVIDFQGNYLEISYSDGGSVQDGWIDISSTSLTKGEILFDRFLDGKDEIDKNWESGRYSFEQASLKDHKKKNPGYGGDFDRIPKMEKDNYYSHKWSPFTKMIKGRVADKKEMATNLVGDYTKFYALDKIFNPMEMQNDQKLETKDRKFVDAGFPGGDVSVSMGNPPDYSKDEDDSSFLTGGGKWIATMEVMYPKEEAKKVNQIILDLPLDNFLYGDAEASGFKGKIELLAIMIAHEFIHTAQNTMLYFQDIARLPNLDSDEKEKRKALREILAHHYTLFPNKVYTSPELDPVFYGTQFVRGKSALFIDISELENIFFLWKAFGFLRRFDSAPDNVLSKKYRIEEMRKDFNDAAKVYSDGKYKVTFDPNSAELSSFFATQPKGLDEDQMYMNYLRSK